MPGFPLDLCSLKFFNLWLPQLLPWMLTALILSRKTRKDGTPALWFVLSLSQSGSLRSRDPWVSASFMLFQQDPLWKELVDRCLVT